MGVTDGLWVAESTDGGHTWGEPRPSVQPHVSSRVFVRRLASGNLLMVKNGAPGDKPTERRDLTAYLSCDDGASWPHALVLDAGRKDVAYPDGQQLGNGLVAVTYDFDRTGTRQILFATFREEDILAGSFTTPDARPRRTIHRGTPANPEEHETSEPRNFETCL
jgi:predicted neuraminidase